jgi:hypothetical protein
MEIINCERSDFKTISWKIVHVDIEQFVLGKSESLKIDSKKFSCSAKLNQYPIFLTAFCFISTDKEILEISLNCCLLKENGFPKDGSVSARCWIELVDGGVSKAEHCVQKMEFHQFKRFSGFPKPYLKSDHSLKFQRAEFHQNSSAIDWDWVVSSINFEIDFVLSRHCDSHTIKELTNSQVALAKLSFFDSILKKLNRSDDQDTRKVKLISKSDEFISVPLNVLIHFSSMMKCMLSGDSNLGIGTMVEARILEIQIDPKFSKSHLDGFYTLLLGEHEERIGLFSNQDIEFFNAIYEFLDMYGFEILKPAIWNRILLLIPDNDYVEWMEFGIWSSRFAISP